MPAYIARFLTIEKTSNTLKSINTFQIGPKMGIFTTKTAQMSTVIKFITNGL